MRLIDADIAIDVLDKTCDRVCKYSKKQRAVMCRACSLAHAFDVIEELPTADAVEVVRCANCKHSYETFAGLICSYGVCVDCVVRDDFYCSFGERKDG